MKTRLQWITLTSTITALTIGLSLKLSGPVNAIPPSIALNGQQVTTLTGTSSGPIRDTTCAGFIAAEANHRITLDRPSNLDFTLKGTNDATLLIIGNNNQRFCVQADTVSQGKVTIPGRWEVGQYDVFVGSRSGQKAAYTLTIGPMEI